MGRSKLENFLKVWGKDKTRGKVLAKDYYCVRCYEGEKEVQAVVLYPYSELDIPFFPYCRPCVDELKLKAMIDLFDID